MQVRRLSRPSFFVVVTNSALRQRGASGVALSFVADCVGIMACFTSRDRRVHRRDHSANPNGHVGHARGSGVMAWFFVVLVWCCATFDTR